jgi:general secretion pathway protein D
MRSKDGRIFADRASNSIVVIDKPEILRQVGEIIEVVDKPLEMKTIELKNVNVNDIQPKIQPFLSPGSKLQVDIASNRITLQDSPREILRFEQLVTEFDQPSLTETQVFVLAHADPAVMVTAIKPELTPEIGRMHQDEATSKIIVTDFPAVLDYIAEIIQDLDIMTPEVMIEVKMIQVSLSDRFRMGVNWEVVSREVNGLGAAGNFNVLIPGEQGLRVGSGELETDDYTILIEALSTIGTTNLLASPRIMALNNEEASLLVGSTVPYKTTDTREEGSSLRTFEKVIFVDVGVKLRVTPRIHKDNLISMKVMPEVSSVISFVDNIPVVKTTQTTTTVTVRDGATAVIAGLIEEEELETIKKVPLLGDIPLLGFLFRSTDKKIDKRELIILLTPRITDVDEEVEIPDLYD